MRGGGVYCEGYGITGPAMTRILWNLFHSRLGGLLGFHKALNHDIPGSFKSLHYARAQLCNACFPNGSVKRLQNLRAEVSTTLVGRDMLFI